MDSSGHGIVHRNSDGLRPRNSPSGGSSSSGMDSSGSGRRRLDSTWHGPCRVPSDEGMAKSSTPPSQPAIAEEDAKVAPME
jgi:hypothetical protein